MNERFKSNAFLNRAVRLHSILKYHIQIGEELFGSKNSCLNFISGLDIASVVQQWARSSDRQSTWLLRCMENTHSSEDTRWSGVQIPPLLPKNKTKGKKMARTKKKEIPFEERLEKKFKKTKNKKPRRKKFKDYIKEHE